MTTVFLSGSRALGRLNDEVRRRIRNITEQRFHIVVGDANGADKALQKYLSELGYGSVTVYCSGTDCRNNVGVWDVKKVPVSPKIKGRDFYTEKDKVMAVDADYGFVLWDGKSAGAIGNVVELLKQSKKALVYQSPQRCFVTVSNLRDLQELLGDCESEDRSLIARKIRLHSSLKQLETSTQGELAF